MSIIEGVWGEALKQGRLAHAYLLIGHSLEHVVDQFLVALYCDEVCGECVQCQKVLKHQHPDIKYIERDGKRIKIEQIRALQRDARYPPLEGKRKVFILKGIESLGIEAANGLLKILESPPPYLHFLLTASTLKVLPTILSRCQVVRFNPTEMKEQAKLLKERGLKKSEIEAALNITRGVPHRFGQILEDLESDSLVQRRDEAREELSATLPLDWIEQLAASEHMAVDREISLRLIHSIVALKPYDLLDVAQALSKLEDEKSERFIEEALRWYRDILIIKSRSSEDHIFNQDQTALLRDHAFSMTRSEIKLAIEKLERGKEIAQGNANLQLFYESLLFTLAGLG